MAISPINSQASQAATLISSLSTSNVPTTVTSNDPTVLAKQEQQILSQITQLQSQNGSSEQIQKLQQAVQTIKNKIQQQDRLAEAKEESNSSIKGVDVKA